MAALVHTESKMRTPFEGLTGRSGDGVKRRVLTGTASLLLAMAATTALAQTPTVPALSTAKPAGPVRGTLLTQDYVKNLATLAYVWGWPLVNMHNRRVVFSKVPENGLGDGVLPVAPLNRLTMLTGYIKPEERAVATPNQDTVYGFGILALDQQPAVFQIPDFGTRYWVYQLGDQRTDAIVGLGSIYGTKPGFYMVVGPDWNGKVPDGITGVFRSPTNLAYIIPRAFMDDTAEDRAAIQPLISQIVAYPVSEFDGKMKTKDWSKLPTLADPAGGKNGSGAETKWVRPEVFFEELPAVLQEVPPQPGEEALYGWFQSLLDAAAKDPKVKAEMTQAAIAADNSILKELHQYRYAGVPVQNGWTSPINGAQFGTDYYSRTAAARANIFVNPRNEAAYFGQEYDHGNRRLSGRNAYTVTFPKDGTPPVSGFWSLTLYDADHFFAPNRINRFSVGTKNKDLKFNGDGSLTIYVQNAQPNPDRQANWLPAPKGEFELFIRAYGPKAEIMNNTWSPPPVLEAE
jgi:hypothetical protein